MAYCSSCGSPIPDGQGSSCSMCMGVVGWGSDGYYENWLEEQYKRELEQKQAEERQMQEELEKRALINKLYREEYKLLWDYYDFCMDEFNGNVSEEGIDIFLEKRHDENVETE